MDPPVACVIWLCTITPSHSKWQLWSCCKGNQSWAAVCFAGQPFALAGGANGKQGMLHAVLKDRLAGRDLVTATTHLKAKAGQVRIAMLMALASNALQCLHSGAANKLPLPAGAIAHSN
jgi:hypothetical protein